MFTIFTKHNSQKFLSPFPTLTFNDQCRIFNPEIRTLGWSTLGTSLSSYSWNQLHNVVFFQRVILPQELVDYIIDFLKGERKDLRRCSLVCWAWVQRSQSHIHHKIMVRSTNDYLFNKVPADYTRYSNPRVAKLVQNLTLWLPHQGHISERDFPEEVLLVVLSRLRGVRKLKLCGDYWGLDPEKKRKLIPNLHIEQITSLTLTFIRFENPEEFLSLLNLFPSLLTISTQYLKWDSGDDELHPDKVISFPSGFPPFRLQRLVFPVSGLSYPLMDVLIQWFGALGQGRGSQDTYQTIHAIFTSEPSAISLADFVVGMGGSLRHLTFNTLDVRYYQNLPAPILVSPHLRTLELILLPISHRCHRFEKHEQSQWHSSLFSSMDVPNLHEVIFRCIGSPDHLCMLPLDVIDEVLSKLPQLRRVFFHMSDKSRRSRDASGGLTPIRKRLPKLYARDVLCLEYDFEFSGPIPHVW